ncbi:MAG TPA: hypothetical protein VG650_14590 [Mycobacteriales bacterium]|nr:hypothetical protein [Mycobacteriales bacterium]
MTLVTAHFDLDLAGLPVKSELLSARFDRVPNANGEPMLLMYPVTTSSAPSHFVRYATGMRLASAARRSGATPTQAGRMGQLIITADRLLGMFIQGSADNRIVDDAKGAIYTFSCSRGDLASVEVKTNWRGKPVEAFLNSTTEQCVPFRLHLFSVVCCLQDDGGYSDADLARVLDRLTQEGRDRLLAPANTKSQL